MIIRILLLVIGYICGMLPTGYIVGRMHGIDIRTKGSGNVGATNTLRVVGKKAAVLVLLFDFLKAFIPCIVTGIIFRDDSLRMVYMAYAGIGAILGHNFPAVLGFRGGKGVASTTGVAYALDWRAALILTVIFALIVLFTRYVSLASVICMFLLAVAALAVPYAGAELKIQICVICGMSIARHHANIGRLIKGNENKIKFGDKK